MREMRGKDLHIPWFTSFPSNLLLGHLGDRRRSGPV